MALIVDQPNQSSVLNGTNDADQIFGLDLDDTLNGGLGNDTLEGGRGDDTVNGGDGDDIIIGGQGDDDVDGGADTDTLTFESTGIAVTLTSQGQIEKTFTNDFFTQTPVGTTSLVTDLAVSPITPSIEIIEGDSTQENFISGVGSSNGQFAINLTSGDLVVEFVGGGFAGQSQSFEIANFNNVIGTINDDVVFGSQDDDVVFGSMGEDELDGSLGNDTLDYSLLTADISIGNFQTATIANPDPSTVAAIPFITVDGALAIKDFGMGTEGDAFTNFETIIGSATGTNTIDGTLDELLSNTYNVDLSQDLLTVNVNGDDRTFNVVNFTDVIGTVNDDVIVGSDADNTFGGSLGNDSFDGGAGFDTADFSAVADNESVPVTLTAGGVVDFGGVFSTTLTDIEEVIASAASTTDLIDASSEEPNKAFINVDLGSGTLDINFIDPFIPVPGGQLSFEIANFENVRGTDNSDTIVGDGGNNTFFASGEFDFYDGAGGTDTVDYSAIDTAISLGGSGVIVKEGLGTDVIRNIENIIADAGFTNVVDGSLNAAGNASFDVTLGETGVAGSLTVTPVVANPFFPAPITFAITNFDSVVGTANDDTITGNSDGNLITGSGGNDIIDGAAGIDTLDYSELGAEVTLQTQGQILKEGLGTDRISSIERIIADDSFRNSINGVEDGAFFNAGGNASFDIALFENRFTLNPENAAPFPPTTFEVVNFTDVVGTVNDDSILGDDQDNILSGSDGDDIVNGRKGVDVLDGGAGNDQLNGGKGNDRLLGSTGDDFLDGGKGARNSADYREFDGAITLGGSGDIAKGVVDGAGNGSLGNDTITRIENIRANAAFTNTIDGSLNAAGNGSFFVDLEQNILEVSISTPGVGPFEFRVFDFDNVVGTVNDDFIIGDANNNVFTGSAGFDLLDGNGGFDTADYSDINTDITLNAIGILEKGALGTDLLVQIDSIVADAGQTNTIDGSDGSIAQLGVDLSQDELTVALFTPGIGQLNFDVQNFQNVVGSANSDFITGDSSNNIFFGSAGNDTYNGNGSPIWVVSDNTVDYSALDASIVLGGSGEIVKEGLGTDTIADIQTIIGSATQTNTIDGQLNAAGNAAFNVDLSAESLDVNLIQGALAGTTFSFNVENFDDVVGTVNDDTIRGNDNNNVIGGSAGNDVINGDDGFDTIDYTGLGAGITLASTGFIRKGGFMDGLGEDTFTNVERIIGDATQINTIDGDTPIRNSASLDVDLRAGTLTVNFEEVLGLDPIGIEIENFDRVIGTDNADTIRGNANSNELFGEGGNDSILGANGADLITGGTGDDSLSGDRGNDLLIGGLGNDSLDGGRGKDILDGVGDDFGANDVDQLTGGANSDLFVLGTALNVYYEGIGEAQILDFETGIDTIQLNGSLADYTFTNDNTIVKDGDLIATTIGNFNTATDFLFV